MPARLFLRLAFAALFFAPLAVHAADFGDPVFPKDMPDDTARAEVIYEKFSRSFHITHGTDYGDIATDTSAFYGRGRIPFGTFTTLDLDGGVIGDDYGLWFGGGLRQLLWNNPVVRVSAVVQAHYTSGFKEKHTGNGGEPIKTELDWLEAEAALLLSHRFAVSEEHAILPYAGAAGSILDVNGDARNRITGQKDDIEAEAKAPFGGVAGMSFLLQGGTALRAEFRYFDRLSFSLAAALAF